jgi:hypothetical protein
MSGNVDKEIVEIHENLKVISYSGTNKESPVEGIFAQQDHTSADGENFVLICEYINGESNGFQISSISIESLSYSNSPLKSG